VILGMLAMPSFISFRQRASLRHGSEQVVAFWNQARFEAAKRNRMVKVGVNDDGAGHFCLGANTTDTVDDSTVCDCFTANSCDVANFPAAPTASFDTQSEWAGVTFVDVNGTTPSLGGVNNSVAVIEPKRGGLTQASQVGALTFAAPKGPRDYKLNFIPDQFGRPILCESNLATDHMSDYANRACSP